MSHTCFKYSLVEQPAIQLFAEMGWQMVSACEEAFGAGDTLGCERNGEAVLLLSRTGGRKMTAHTAHGIQRQIANLAFVCDLLSRGCYQVQLSLAVLVLL